MYAFGYGLSYTEFSYKDLRVTADDTITATFKVTNTGNRAGVDVPQIYLTKAAGDKRIRLLGFERVELKPGESREISITTDPRLLARFDGAKQQWRIDEGTHVVSLSRSADNSVETKSVEIKGRLFGQ